MGGILTALRGVHSDCIADYSNRVVCKVSVENETEYKLMNPRYYIELGRLGYTPEEIEQNSEGAFIAHQTLANASGTTGVVAWEIDSPDKLMLVIMWSAPFDFNFYKNVFSIGFLPKRHAIDRSLYFQMYNNGENLFTSKICSSQYDSQPITHWNGRLSITGTMEKEHRCHVAVSLNTSLTAVLAEEPYGSDAEKKAAAFKKMFPKLVEGLKDCIKSVADFLFSSSLISDEKYSEVIEINATQKDIARNILLNIHGRIKEHSNEFDLFCDAIAQVQGCTSLIKSLRNSLQQP